MPPRPPRSPIVTLRGLFDDEDPDVEIPPALRDEIYAAEANTPAAQIGGALGLLGAGLSGTLAEAEIRSKDENAQMIWLEMQRRKADKDKPKRSKKKKGRRTTTKKDMTGKQKKRLSALEELMVEAEDSVQSTIEMNDTPTVEPEDDLIKGEGLLGKMKSFYDQADQMAATNALILNKELEERGVLEKITDETGLKVVGKDAVQSKKGDEKKD
ncbi:hypothetical protein THAOC_36623 [Thalassiosira oceanica]|uniref:Uncharacterized protein n=1 Tax=Thalassiosira oceanica TaxID=159749 RepID=K0R7V5_THAOC|nr:hypothetical protein THAOC_36623 [Thalassiosira oceanica]|eukprot:EJK44806.1 hypothetical protein THAOC_36623 [Thalassiosira oceanica]